MAQLASSSLIDLTGMDDDEQGPARRSPSVEITGHRVPLRRSRPLRHHSAAHSSPSNAILVLDSDDEGSDPVERGLPSQDPNALVLPGAYPEQVRRLNHQSRIQPNNATPSRSRRAAVARPWEEDARNPFLDNNPPAPRPAGGLGGGILRLHRARTLGIADILNPNEDRVFRPAINYLLNIHNLFGMGGVGVFNSGLPREGDETKMNHKVIHGDKPPRASFSYNFEVKPPPPPVQPRENGKGKRKADAIDVDSQPEAESGGLLLLCSTPKCSKPLMIGLNGVDRIWGLRCGHLICGGCLETIGRPPPPIVVDEEDLIPRVVTSSSKGKGKAKNQTIDSSNSVNEASSSRLSTLRPRTASTAGPLRPSRAKAKGKAKAQPVLPPSVAKEWSYVCPVGDCGKVHIRVLVVPSHGDDAEGVWKPKEDLGEIEVYT